MDSSNNVFNQDKQIKRPPTLVNPNVRKTSQVYVEHTDSESSNNPPLKPGRPTLVTAGENPAERFPAGTIIEEKYIIKRAINTVSGEARLYVCTERESGKEYCFKIYNESGHVQEDVRKVLMTFQQRNIAQLASWGYLEDRIYEIWDYYRGETLLEKIQNGCISESQIKTYLSQMNQALYELHSRGMVHQDIKSSNFMIIDDGTVVLIDFGLCSITGEGGRTHVSQLGHTTEYSAPEVLMSDFCWSASDYYSLGITLFEMLTGKTPFSNYDDNNVVRKNEDMMFIKIPAIDNFSEKMQDLIVGLLQYNHQDRWGYEDVQKWLLQKDYVKPKRPISGKTFRFSGENYQIPSQIPELVIRMCRYWRDGISNMDSEGRFLRLRDLLNGMDGVDELWAVCNETKPDNDVDRFYFQRLYKLYPGLKMFAWRGVVFNDRKELGSAILDLLWEREGREMNELPEREKNPFESGNTEPTLYFSDLAPMFKKHIISYYLNLMGENGLRDQIYGYEKKIEEISWHNNIGDLLIWYYRIGYALSESTELHLRPGIREYDYADKEAFVKKVNRVIDECDQRNDNSYFFEFCRFIYDGKINAGFSAWAEHLGYGHAVARLVEDMRGVSS